MADPNAALATQLKNIEARTGRSLAQLRQLLDGSGLHKHGERRAWLMQTLGLGHGDANTVVHLAAQAQTPAPPDDPLDAIYSGAKAGLRPLHEHLMARLQAFGDFEIAPKKAYLSLRRKKQFAMLGPATQSQLELGLNIKTLPPHPRLKDQGPGKMCNFTLRLGSAAEIDADLLAWVRAAYDAAA